MLVDLLVWLGVVFAAYIAWSLYNGIETLPEDRDPRSSRRLDEAADKPTGADPAVRTRTKGVEEGTATARLVPFSFLPRLTPETSATPLTLAASDGNAVVPSSRRSEPGQGLVPLSKNGHCGLNPRSFARSDAIKRLCVADSLLLRLSSPLHRHGEGWG